MTDRAQQAADAIAAVAGLTPAVARRTLNEYAVRDQAAALAVAGGGSQPFRIVTLDVAFDTPGLVIPASGPAGILLTEVADYEALVSIQADVFMNILNFTAWNGTTPTLQLCTTAGRGNLPGTPPTSFNNTGALDFSVDSDDSGTGAYVFTSTLDAETTYFHPATSLYAYIDDGSGGDPNTPTPMTQGTGRIVLVLADFS